MNTTKKIEAKPNTDLRAVCLTILSEAGFAGPSINLDDISAYVYRTREGNIKVGFWDMDYLVTEENELFQDLLDNLEGE